MFGDDIHEINNYWPGVDEMDDMHFDMRRDEIERRMMDGFVFDIDQEVFVTT